jgi:predicted CoA-binding protein
MDRSYGPLELTRDDIDRLLDTHTVAVIGLSPDPARPSNRVARYLVQNGYRIVPVNPNFKELLGEKCYPSLADIPFQVEAVNVFRRPEHLAGVIDEAIAKGVIGVWGQLGVRDEEAAERGRRAGLTVVQNRCWQVEHSLRRL